MTSRVSPVGATDFVLAPAPGETPPASQIGGKAYNLARLAGIPGNRLRASSGT